MHIKDYIRILRGNLETTSYKDDMNVEFIRTLGGKYWKMLSNKDKLSYLKLMNNICKDDPSDYHVGDINFQNTVIGKVNEWVVEVKKTLSSGYCDSEVSEFPQKLYEMISTSKSNFEFKKLVKNFSKYVRKLGKPESRQRRYSASGECMRVPAHKEAVAHTFMLMRQIDDGYKWLRSLPPEEQEVHILEGIQSNVNMGWPFFMTQDKTSFKAYWIQFLEEYLDWKVDKATFYLTVQHLEEVQALCLKIGFYPPYTCFYRVSGGRKGETKHRNVFGGHIIEKYAGGVVHAAKHFGYYISRNPNLLQVTSKHYRETKDERIDGDKYITEVGNMPIVAQYDWDDMFNTLCELLPLKDKYSAAEIKSIYGADVRSGDYYLNVVGEDFDSFDTGICIEDFEFIKTFQGLGHILEYIIEDLRNAQAWLGTMRVFDVINKSGHPMTSDGGSGFHRNCQYNFRDFLRKKYKTDEIYIIFATNLADDCVVCWAIPFGLKIDISDEFESYMKSFGLTVKAGSSHNFKKDGWVSFLKVLCGRISKLSNTVKDDDQTDIGFVGDPQSRYYGMAHSEREIEQDFVKDKYRANVQGLWKVTGIIEYDSVISRLSTFGRGKEGAKLVLAFLSLVKGTVFGSNLILFISRIDPSASYELYRSDVQIGFNPAWLGTLPVLTLLTDQGTNVT